MDNALEIHAHYSKLFEAFAVLPPDDIGGALFERACELWAESPWNEFGKFLERVESYLEQSQLSPERRARVAKFLTKQKPHYERSRWKPEERPRLIEWERQELIHRRRTLEGYLRNFDEAPDWRRKMFYAPSVGSVLISVTKTEILPALYSSAAQWDYSVWTDSGEHRQSLEKSLKEVKRRLELLANQQKLQAPATTEPLDTPAFTVIKSQAQLLSEMIAQIATDAEASANAKGFTLVGKPGNPVPPAPPQTLKAPTKGTPAGAPLLTWDEFLPHFRWAVRLINQDEFTEADCERLTQLGQHLVKELDNSIKKRPTATKLRLTENLRECLNEMPHAETMLSHKLAELEKTPALYDARSPLIREAMAAAEDTIGGLIELLSKYYPETLTGSIRTTNGPLAVSELVLKYLPGFHDLNKKIRFERAALATIEPPQFGSPALDTPAPSPWGPLLTGLLELPALFTFFADCGLLTPAGELTALGRADGQNKARKAPWAGTLQALIQSQHLDGNSAAICRALSDPAGGIQMSLNEGALRNYSTKAGTYLTLANGYLKERGILRN